MSMYRSNTEQEMNYFGAAVMDKLRSDLKDLIAKEVQPQINELVDQVIADLDVSCFKQISPMQLGEQLLVDIRNKRNSR